MKLTLAEPKFLKDSISIISDLVNEGRFKITTSSIELVAMDPANVAMVIFKLLSSAFVEYDVKKEVELSINLNNLKQVLKRAKPTDTLSLEVAESKLKVTLKSGTVRTFYIPIIEMEEKEQKVPNLTFPITIKTSSSVLTEAIEDADIVAESLSFSVEASTFIVEAEGDLSKAKIEIKEGDDTKITVEGKENIRAKYSIEYLKKMIGASKLANEVTIQFSKDYPLKLEFKVVDKLMMSFILAPRVDND